MPWHALECVHGLWEENHPRGCWWEKRSPGSGTGALLTARGTTCHPASGIWVLKVMFPRLVPPGEMLAVAQRSVSGPASYLWRWRAVLQNKESWAGIQMGMPTALDRLFTERFLPVRCRRALL